MTIKQKPTSLAEVNSDV